MGCKLQVVTEILDASVVIRSHDDALRYLMLLNTVVHPVSLWQIQKETAYQSKSRHPQNVRALRNEGDHAVPDSTNPGADLLVYRDLATVDALNGNNLSRLS